MSRASHGNGLHPGQRCCCVITKKPRNLRRHSNLSSILQSGSSCCVVCCVCAAAFPLPLSSGALLPALPCCVSRARALGAPLGRPGRGLQKSSTALHAPLALLSSTPAELQVLMHPIIACPSNHLLICCGCKEPDRHCMHKYLGKQSSHL